MSAVSLEELAKHNKPEDLWVAIHGRVFDVTKFAGEHPGGKKVLHNVGGKDATAQFDQFHKPDVLMKYGPNMYVGKLSSGAQASTVKKGEPLPDGPNAFGEMVPFGDPTWYQDWHSPYFNESHRKFRAAVREFVDKEITPNCHEWDEARAVPRDFHKKCAKAGFLPLCIGLPYPKEYVPDVALPGGIKPEELDNFHEMILFDELGRCGSGGVTWALSGGLSIGLPPVIHFGSKYLQDKVVRDCLLGEKVICLAITEPSAGSDVANLKTEAKLTPDGKHYIVNGEKKWITNGVFADFFTVAVRTGGKGFAGVSLLLIEKTMPGVKCTQMKCSGVWPSGTTYITFEDVKVPIDNLIGKENNGFKYISTCTL